MLNKNLKLIAAITGVRFFGPDGDTLPASGGQDTLQGGGGNQNQGKTYTEAELQAQVNRINAEEKRKWQQKLNDLDTKHKQLQNDASLTSQQKEKLNEEIETLRQSMQTREQQQASELDTLKKRYESDTKKHQDEAGNWKSLFQSHKISVDIASAFSAEAFNVTQIDALLRPLSITEQEIGPDGKPTGNWVTFINWTTTDKEGKPVKLKLSPEDVKKAMKDKPDQYGNLFKNTSQSGLDSTNGSGGNGSGSGPTRIPDVENMTPEEYKKNREAIRRAMTV